MAAQRWLSASLCVAPAAMVARRQLSSLWSRDTMLMELVLRLLVVRYQWIYQYTTQHIYLPKTTSLKPARVRHPRRGARD